MTENTKEGLALTQGIHLNNDELDEQERKFLTFPLHNSLYGIEINHVLEVVIFGTTSKITSIPHMPNYTKGVINLRGKVIPVIDLRTRFLLPEIKYDNRTCFVVVNIHGVVTGLIIDTVYGVVSIPKVDIDPPPEMDNQLETISIEGMGKTKDEIYILLNIHNMLQKTEIEQLKKVSSL